MSTWATVAVAAGSSCLTTLAVHAARAWRYRSRPVDFTALQRAMEIAWGGAAANERPAGEL